MSSKDQVVQTEEENKTNLSTDIPCFRWKSWPIVQCVSLSICYNLVIKQQLITMTIEASSVDLIVDTFDACILD